MRASRRTVCLLMLAPLAASLSCGGSSDAVGPDGPVGSVEVSPAVDTVRVGGSVTLQAIVHDTKGRVMSGRSVFWDSEHTDIATVNDQGVVTGIAPGDVTVAASVSGKSGSATVTVLPPGVATVKIDPPSASVQIGGTVQLNASTLDADGNPLTGRSIEWSSSDDKTAAVDQNGKVTGVAAGSATITATSEGKSATATITVSAKPVASVSVSPDSPDITVGQTVQLHATTLDSDGKTLTGRSVSWESSDDGIATVSSSGLVTGIAPGSATISATSEGKTGRAQVSVAPVPANSVIVSPSSATIIVGQTMQLSAQVTDSKGNVLPGRSVSWSSDKPSIATVSGSGVVKGMAQGTATITASSEGKTGHATITVNPVPVASVDVAPSSANLNVGDTKQLTATPKDADGHPLSGRTVTWSSSNPSSVTVSTSGLVTAAAPGSAVITAMSEGQRGFATINVAQVAVASVDISPQNPSIAIGDQVTLTATPRDANGHALSGRSVQWFSSEESTAGITPTSATTAVVTGKAIGQATITATSEGQTGRTTVTVTQAAVETVVVSPADTTIQVGGSAQFSAVTKDKNGNTLTGRSVTWSSNNPGVASIDAQSGKVTGVSQGSATITATSEGKTGTTQITVVPVPVGSVDVSPSSQSVQVGDTTRFTATVKDAQGNALTDRTVTWASSNPQIATVDAQGLAKGVAEGTVTITATSSDDRSKTGSATLNVTPMAVGSIVVSPHEASVPVYHTVQLGATTLDVNGRPLTGRTISWASSAPAIASATVAGPSTDAVVVTGILAGPATITASVEGHSDAASITVTPPLVSMVVVDPPSQTLVAGESTQLTAKRLDEQGHELSNDSLTWESKSPDVASVSASGLVEARAPGTAVITATSQKVSGSATITVIPVPVAKVTVLPADTTLKEGDSVQLVATLTSATGDILVGRSVTWSSAPDGFATVDQNGRVKAQKAGTATITATSENVSGTATVTILKKEH